MESTTTGRVLNALPPGDFSYTPHSRSSTAGTIAWTIVRGLRVCQELLNAPSAALSQGGTVTSNGTAILRQPLGQILWLFHCDAIHYRGQLSTYLRTLGAEVPAI